MNIIPGQTLSKPGLGDEPPAEAVPGLISASRMNSKSDKLQIQKSEERKNSSSTAGPLSNQNTSQMQAIPLCESVHPVFAFSSSALSSFAVHPGLNGNTLDTGSLVLAASFNPSKARSTPIVVTTNRGSWQECRVQR